MSPKPLLLLWIVVFLASVARAAPPKIITVAATTQPIAASASMGADLASAFDDQLSRMLSGQPTLVETDLAGLSSEDRDLVSTLIQGLSTFRQTARSAATSEEKTRPLLELSDQIRQRANLTVSHLSLCTTVDRFGVYEPIATKELPAKTETPAVLYCEIDNFQSKLNAKGQYETRLTYELALYGDSPAASAPVFTKPASAVIDRCRNRRRDFFIADRITLPGTLSAGRYVLKVTITDTQSKRIGEATLPIELHPKP
jgi:hypothetical protein